jgi:hypothetical protein
MSFKIKFYELFLEEKNQKVEDYFKGNLINVNTKKIQEILVHKFLTKIIEDIEIETEITDDETTHIYLQKLFFRRPPECFFLNEIRKYNFETRMNITSEVTKQQDLFAEVVPFTYIM